MSKDLPSCLPSVPFRGRPIMEREVLVRLQDPVSTMRNRVSKFWQVVGKHFARQIAFRLEMNVLLKLRMCLSAFIRLMLIGSKMELQTLLVSTVHISTLPNMMNM
ncbi:hypothetical protein LOK49_Contig152G00003 [Camellia lanceoleosa]|nr:hypothetical protein LOK49_Contig152G00003 [Camellia lanceoleosa]